MKLIINNNLYLRHFSQDDKQELFSLVDANREHLNIYLAWPMKTKTPEDSLWFINDSLKDGIEKCYVWAIIKDEKIVGVCSYNFLSLQNKTTEIGYWLGKEYTGEGIVTAAVDKLLDHAFNTLDLNRVAIKAATTNTASSSIPKRLGFKHEGILRKVEVVGSNTYDHDVYSILKEEYKK